MRGGAGFLVAPGFFELAGAGVLTFAFSPAQFVRIR